MSRWSRFVNVFRSGSLNRDLDDEFQFHLQERIRDLTASGMSREAAGTEAARRLGSPLRLREESRDIKLMSWLDSILRDVRLGGRMLRKNAVVTSAAVISLALALGACVAAFSLVDALILRPLPVRDPGQLIYLAFPTYTPERPESDTFNDPLFVRLRDAARDRVDLFAMSTQVMRPAIFEHDGEKEQIRTQFVSGDAFDLLGVRAARGRLLNPQDDVQPGGSAVVVSHGFWLRRFGGDPSIVGRMFSVGGRQVRIVGVAESGFTGIDPGRPNDLWLPYASYNPRAFGNAEFNWFRVLGRLKGSRSPEAAQSVLQTAFTNFRRDRAAISGPRGRPEELARFVAAPLYVRSAANGVSPVRRQFERSLWILATIAGLVLLVAGSNVGNLFFARAAGRERELALRLSIGAGRGRLIQQVLIESAIVAGIACVLGVLFAALAAPSVVRMLASADDPVQLDLRLDWHLAAFAAILTLLTTALFGLAPAFRASRVAPMTTLKTGGGRAGARAGVMRPFVALQVAFGLVVLFVGGLLVLSFARLSSVNPGFATSDVLLLNVEPTQPMDAKQQRAGLLTVLERLRLVPGVQGAGAAEYNPIGRAWTIFIRVPGTAHDEIEATMAPVTAGFFETMKIPVLAGRPFVRQDMDLDRSAAVVVNETFANRYFGREPAVGRILAGRFGESDDTPSQHDVVGVVADARYDLRQPAAPTIYFPLRTSGTIHVRVAGDPVALAARLREDIRAADPLFRVTSITSESAVVDQTLLRERLLATLAGFFAVVGLLLVAVGLYGVLSYSVVHRTREIGIRMALGARPLGVIRTILADVGVAVLTGAVCGLAGGLYLSRFVEVLLFEVAPRDFLSVALPLVTLTLTVAVAIALPALRAARVEPVIALRYE